MKLRNIALVLLLIISGIAAFSIQLRPPEIDSIDVKVHEAVYTQSVFEDGEISVKVTVRNNSTKPLRIKEATLVSYALGFRLGEGKQASIVVQPGKEKTIRFAVMEDWRNIPLFEPERQQSYDFIADVIGVGGSKMEFIHLIPIPRVDSRQSIFGEE